jgi:O-antigen/teichoic acid export membrane protein
MARSTVPSKQRIKYRGTRRKPSRWGALRMLLPASMANLSVQAMLVLLGLLTGILSARVLGPQKRGELSFLVLVPTMLTVLGSLGTEYGVYYFWHQKEGALRSKLLGTSVIVSALSGAAFGIVGFFIVSLIERSAGLTLDILVAVSIPLSIANAVMTMALMANSKLTPYNVSRLTGPITYTCAIAALWASGALIIFNAFVAWFGSAVLTVIIDFGLLLSLGSGKPDWDTKIVRQSITYGLRSYIGTVSQYGTLRLDQTLLAGLAGNNALGLYYAAVSVGETVLYLANNVGAAMMAQFAGRPRIDKRRLAMMTIVVVGAGTSVAAALLMFFGGPVITLLLGRAYLPGLTAMRILLPGIVPLAMARIMSGYFIAIGEARVFARASLVSLALTIVGDVALIPKFQAVGAAVASSLAYCVLAMLLALVFRTDSAVIASSGTATATENQGTLLG